MGRRVSSASRGSIAQLDGSGKYEKRSHRQGETKGVRLAWESKFEVGFLTLSILSYNTLTTAEVGNWGKADHIYIYVVVDGTGARSYAIYSPTPGECSQIRQRNLLTTPFTS